MAWDQGRLSPLEAGGNQCRINRGANGAMARGPPQRGPPAADVNLFFLPEVINTNTLCYVCSYRQAYADTRIYNSVVCWPSILSVSLALQLCVGYEAIKSALLNIGTGDQQNGTTRHDANCLAGSMDTLETALMSVLWNAVLIYTL